jgi:peptidoglycan/xylan/chitin deacetylase (PgdA/CDA1 family)
MITTQLRPLLFSGLQKIGLSKVLRKYHQRKKQIPILLFHRVDSIYDVFTEPLNPAYFEQIILWLSKKYVFVDLKKALSNPAQLKGNEVVITFDDATQDFQDFAWPILKKYDVPVTVFVPTAYPNHSPIWNNQVFECFLFAQNKNVEVDFQGVVFQLSLTKEKIYEEAFSVINHLLSLNFDQIQEAILRLQKVLHPTQIDQFAPTMTWETISILKNEGVKFESHSHNHLYLPNQQDEMISNEMIISQQALANSTNIDAQMIAYPVGGTNEKVEHITSHRFKYGLGVTGKLWDTQGPIHSFNIDRINIHDSHFPELQLRIQGFHRLFQK